MQQTMKVINLVHLEELSGERSRQATGTKRLNQFRQPLMVMGGASMAPKRNKIDHDVFFLMLAPSYHLCTVPLGPPGSSASTLWTIQAPPEHHRSPIAPMLLPHPMAPPNMPQERGKPKRATRNKNSITRDNRLTTSQRALLANFSPPHRHTSNTQSIPCTPKMETPSPTVHSPLLPLTSLCIPKKETPTPTVHSLASTSKEEAPQGLNSDKVEGPPPMKPLSSMLVDIGPHSTSLPGPSPVNKTGSPSKTCLPSLPVPEFQPRWWEGGCIVEEEIPPRWQLLEAGENPITVEDLGTDGGEKDSHHTYHLAVKHLELLFDIRQ
jgi:hypothetical protein